MRYIMFVVRLRNITSDLALKNVFPSITKRWNRQLMEQMRLKFFMYLPSKWNSKLSKILTLTLFHLTY